MSAASGLDWNAVAAVSAAATFVVGAFLSWRGGIRSPVTARVIRLEVFAGGQKLRAAKLYLKNRGSHIENCRIRIERYSAASSIISETSSVDKNEIELKNSNGGFLIVIPSFPAGEVIEVDLASNTTFFESSIKGGTNKYIVEDIESVIFKRFFWIGAALILSVALYGALSTL